MEVPRNKLQQVMALLQLRFKNQVRQPQLLNLLDASMLIMIHFIKRIKILGRLLLLRE